MSVLLIFRNSAPVRRAYSRNAEGRVSDVIIADPEMGYKEAEKELLRAAKENGVAANDKNIRIEGDKPKVAEKSVSYGSGPLKRKR